MRFIIKNKTIKEGNREGNVLIKDTIPQLKKYVKQLDGESEQEYFNFLRKVLTWKASDEEADARILGFDGVKGRNKITALYKKLKYSSPAITQLSIAMAPILLPDASTHGRNIYIKWLGKQLSQDPRFSNRSPDTEDLYALKQFFEYTKTNAAKGKGIVFDYRLNFSQMLEVAKKHINSLQVGQSRIEKGEKLASGFTIVKISRDNYTPDEIIRDAYTESCELGHCLSKKYIQSIADGNVDYYSLRNESGKSCVTITYRKRTDKVFEIVGAGNATPSGKYLSILIPWLRKNFTPDQLSDVFESDTKIAVAYNTIK